MTTSTDNFDYGGHLPYRLCENIPSDLKYLSNKEYHILNNKLEDEKKRLHKIYTHYLYNDRITYYNHVHYKINKIIIKLSEDQKLIRNIYNKSFFYKESLINYSEFLPIDANTLMNIFSFNILRRIFVKMNNNIDPPKVKEYLIKSILCYDKKIYVRAIFNIIKESNRNVLDNIINRFKKHVILHDDLFYNDNNECKRDVLRKTIFKLFIRDLYKRDPFKLGDTRIMSLIQSFLVYTKYI
ncbi:MAG: hypothetical protein CBB97_22625 [Candidatus Endolissoclinum sp. TMED37]|nr:MAG: hypothetical protein CBB97_22625 [Candidatus Endolissoclinum sp. TMED37]|tara:strand:- start:2038 stop:2757 length:720 start_codon:yes stop_codon:yes gene_type:complete